MIHFKIAFATAFLLGVSVESAVGGTFFSSEIVPNAAPDEVSGAAQTIAGESAAGTEWDIEKGRAKILETQKGALRLEVKVKGLIVPVLEEPFPVDPTAFPFPVPNPATCANFGFPEGVPCFGFSPSPLFLARIVCHDAAGEAEVVDTRPSATRSSHIRLTSSSVFFDSASS